MMALTRRVAGLLTTASPQSLDQHGNKGALDDQAAKCLDERHRAAWGEDVAEGVPMKRLQARNEGSLRLLNPPVCPLSATPASESTAKPQTTATYANKMRPRR